MDERFELSADSDGRVATIALPNSYEVEMVDEMAQSEELALYRLLTLSRRVAIRAPLEGQITARVQTSPWLFSLLAGLITLESAEHVIDRGDDR